MDKSKLIWGIVCLVLAGLLAVLNSTLPENKLMFMIGDRNLPIVPIVVLSVLGIILLATAWKTDSGDVKTSTQEQQPQDPETLAKIALNKRLESIGWGLFLIMLGGFALVPGDTIPRGVWSIGVGLIMLGLNVARYLNQIKMSGFTTFLGILSLISGVLQLLGMEVLEGATLIIMLGLYLLVKPWFDRRQFFGKAEEG